MISKLRLAHSTTTNHNQVRRSRVGYKLAETEDLLRGFNAACNDFFREHLVPVSRNWNQSKFYSEKP